MVGQTILHYRVVEKLGAGGMGEIYKAEDTRLKRVVAVKVLSPRLSAEPERRKRFFQEARAASALNHPNIITLYDIISEGDTQCIVMEYVAGKTLRDLIPTRGLPASQALKYATQMAAALAAAHTAGIIHRDLKPSNVMVTTSGLVKILDFGLAKWIDPSLSIQPEDQATGERGLTTEGSIIGTVSYMSPEQAVGKRLDARSDIFSFGSVMYEMVTGRRAFEGNSGISTLSSILRDDVKPIPEVAPTVPPGLAQVILRCLPKETDARWQSMKEIEARLIALDRQLEANGRYAAPAQGDDIRAVTGAVPAASLAPPASPAAASPKASKPAVPAVSARRPATTPKRSAATTPRRATSKSSKPIALIWGAVGMVLIASAVTGGWWLWKGQRQAPSPLAAHVTAPEPTSQPLAIVPATPAPSAPEIPAQETAPAPPPPEPARTAARPVPPKRPAAVKTRPAPKTALAPAPKRPEATGAGAASPQPVAELPPPPKPADSAYRAPTAPPPPAVSNVPVSVGDALPFRIVLSEDIPSDIEQGKTLHFTVADGLRVGETVVIAKGAGVTGMIAREAGKRKFLFGGNKTTFELQQVDSVDGKKLNARVSAGRPSDGIATRTFDTGKGSKPKGLVAAQGTEYIGYIDGDQTVSVSKSN